MRKTILFVCLLLAAVATMQAKPKTLPEVKFSAQPAVLTGRVLNAGGAGELIVSVHPVIGGEATETAVKIAADGTFNAPVYVGVSTMTTFKVGAEQAEAVLVPGEATQLTYDGSAARKWQFGGALAAFNTDMANADPALNPARSYQAIQGRGLFQLKGKTVQDYKNTLMGLIDAYKAKIAADKQTCDEYKDYCTTVATVYGAIMLTAHNRLLNYANQSPQNYTLPADFYAGYAKQTDLLTRPAIGYSPFASDVENLAKRLGADMNLTFAAPANLAKVSQAAAYRKQIDELKPLTDAQMAEIHAAIPEFEHQLAAANEVTKQKVEANKRKSGYTVREIPATAEGEDVFKAIVAPYKGQPVLVDFWATWCGPCRAAMKTVVPVKEELAGKVNFVYVTGETSPKAKWNDMIPDIHGDHYYVTAAQWTTLLDQFKAQGIPAYVVAGKDGNVQKTFIGFPGVEEMRAELLKALAQ